MGNGRLRCNIHRGIRHAHAHSRQALRKWQARTGNGSGLDQIHPAARGCRQGRLRGVANAESGKRQRLYESTERLLHELSPCVPRENTLCEAIEVGVQKGASWVVSEGSEEVLNAPAALSWRRRWTIGSWLTDRTAHIQHSRSRNR